MSKDVKKLKDTIKILFMQGKSPHQIKAMLGVSPSTIYKWVNRDGWEAERKSRNRAFSRSPEKLLEALDELMNKMQSAGTPVDFAKYADAFSKITKSIKSLFKDQDRFSQILFSFGEFRAYVAEQQKIKGYDDDFYEKLDKLLEGFQDEVIKKFSPKNMS